jgi:hypothetical protein
MHNDVIYFFFDNIIQEQPDKYKKCPCGEPDCDLLVFDNGFDYNEELPENIIQVDFTKKRKLNK